MLDMIRVPLDVCKVLIARKDYEEAEQNLQHALKIDAENTLALYLYAVLEDCVGNLARSLEYATQAIEKDPNSITINQQFFGAARQLNVKVDGLNKTHFESLVNHFNPANEVLYQFSNEYFDLATLVTRPTPCIIDVGANKGTMTQAYRSLFPNATIHSFEPIPQLNQLLNQRFSLDKNISVYPVALGDENKLLPFNITKAKVSSSFLAIDETSKTDLHVVETINVEQRTLDSYNQFEQVDLLKLDVEGFELHVIRGAGELLKRTQFIFCELTYQSIRVNQAFPDNIHREMRTRGFQLYKYYNFKYTEEGLCFGCDALYKRQ